MPKPAERLQKQSNVSRAELPTEPVPGQTLETAYQAGATKAGSPDTHDSHADTALVNSKALSPSGHPPAKEDAASAALPYKAGGPADCGGSTKAVEHSAFRPDVTAREM